MMYRVDLSPRKRHGVDGLDHNAARLPRSRCAWECPGLERLLIEALDFRLHLPKLEAQAYGCVPNFGAFSRARRRSLTPVCHQTPRACAVGLQPGGASWLERLCNRLPRRKVGASETFCPLPGSAEANGGLGSKNCEVCRGKALRKQHFAAAAASFCDRLPDIFANKEHFADTSGWGSRISHPFQAFSHHRARVLTRILGPSKSGGQLKCPSTRRLRTLVSLSDPGSRLSVFSAKGDRPSPGMGTTKPQGRRRSVSKACKVRSVGHCSRENALEASGLDTC